MAAHKMYDFRSENLSFKLLKFQNKGIKMAYNSFILVKKMMPYAAPMSNAQRRLGFR